MVCGIWCLEGVPAERDAQARLIFRSWRDALEKGQLEAFAWNSMLACEGGRTPESHRRGKRPVSLLLHDSDADSHLRRRGWGWRDDWLSTCLSHAPRCGSHAGHYWLRVVVVISISSQELYQPIPILSA